MVHRLAKPHPSHGAGPNPVTVGIRYRCDCAQNEVLQIQVVLDLNLEEEHFIWTMRQLWRDVKTEVEQHTAQGQLRKHG